MRTFIATSIIIGALLFSGRSFAQTQAELEAQYHALLLQLVTMLQAQVSSLGSGTPPVLSSGSGEIVLPIGQACILTYHGQHDIARIQEALLAQGHTLSKIDGVIGPETRAAVTSFQTAAGITVDGLIGNQVRTALAQHSVRCVGDEGVTVADSGSVPTPISVPAEPLCQLRYHGDTDVSVLQRELQAQGYTINAIDGTIGAETRAAVTAFQTAAGITVDGLVGNEVRSALARRSVTCSVATTPTVPVTPTQPAEPATPTAPVQPVQPTTPTTPASPNVSFGRDEVLAAVRSTSVSNDTAVFTYHLSAQNTSPVYISADPAQAFSIRVFNQAGTQVSSTGAIASLVSPAQKIVRIDGSSFFLIQNGNTLSLRLSIQPGSGAYYAELERVMYTTDNAGTVQNPTMTGHSFNATEWRSGTVTLTN